MAGWTSARRAKKLFAVSSLLVVMHPNRLTIQPPRVSHGRAINSTTPRHLPADFISSAPIDYIHHCTSMSIELRSVIQVMTPKQIRIPHSNQKSMHRLSYRRGAHESYSAAREQPPHPLDTQRGGCHALQYLVSQR